MMVYISVDDSSWLDKKKLSILYVKLGSCLLWEWTSVRENPNENVYKEVGKVE